MGWGEFYFFFLQKDTKVLTVESDDAYIEELSEIAGKLGYKVNITDKDSLNITQFLNNDLTIIKAQDYSEIGDNIFNFTNWSFIVNDGIARKKVLEKIITLDSQPIVILDNIEYCANWGHLARSSAKPEQVKV